MPFVDFDKDIINISPHEGDVKGEIIHVSGLNIQLPQKPSDKYILFHDEPKEEQYWRKIELPEDFLSIQSEEELRSLPDAIQKRYDAIIAREWNRRKNGLWFYNNGEPTYLTGNHYMLLQYGDFDFIPKFHYSQWEWHIHAKACEVDPRCDGQISGKRRRWGWTTMVGNKITDDTTRHRRKNSYILSKSEEDAKDPCFQRTVDVFNGYPFFFRVIGDVYGSSLILDEPKKKQTDKNRVKKKSKGIGSSITYGATKNNKFDGKKAFRLMLDEMGKLEKPADFWKLWDIHKFCLYDGVKRIGKAYIGTTVEEHDKGGAAFKKIYYQSDPNNRLRNGRTESGLYKYFTSALDNYIVDKYGMPIIETPKELTYDIDGHQVMLGAREEIEVELKAREKDVPALNEYKRKMPVTESDMFRVVGGNSIDSERIFTQIQYNEQHAAQLQPRQGYFAWSGERWKSPVEWVDDKKGRWRIGVFLHQEDRNKYSNRGGYWYPENKHLGSSGVDPYRVDQVQYGKGSNASCHIFMRPSAKYTDRDACVARYNGRPETLYMASEEILMAHIYFGVQALIESQVDIMIRHWEDMGFAGYLMRSPPKLMSKSAKKRGYGISTSGTNVRSSLLHEIQSHVRENVGQMDDGSMGYMPFNETLMDLSEFDINNATDYDDSISFGVGLLGLHGHTEVQKQKINVTTQLARKYNNSGNSSQLIR